MSTPINKPLSPDAIRVGRAIEQIRESRTATPIGYVEAVVRIPLYRGDDIEHTCWDWIEYAQPGITPQGTIGVCKRVVQLIDAKVVLQKTHDPQQR